ncbi:hypothetical protein KR222_005052, partial [Zaprionus bogoriensis]
SVGRLYTLLWVINMAAAGTILPPQSLSSVFFAKNLFRAFNEVEEVNANLIVSPAAARSAMTLVFMASAGKSAEELRYGLLLGPAKKLEIAKQHAKFLSDDCVCEDKGVSIRLATRLYVNADQELKADFNTNAMEFFNAQVDSLNFTDSEAAVLQANKWLEKQMFKAVRSLLNPASFTPKSSVVLVNSLFFRAPWATHFLEANTALDDFWINKKQRMHVSMMRQVGRFRYGKSHKLRAQILQLPFANSDITFLIILPREIDGIRKLEKTLKDFDLNEVAMRSVMHDVDVSIPKFRIEGDIDLKIPLVKVSHRIIHDIESDIIFKTNFQMGITSIFAAGTADLSDLFAKKSPDLITESRQKVFLDVGEAGVCTLSKARKLILPFHHMLYPSSFFFSLAGNVELNAFTDPDRKFFKANRPFVFAIRNNRTVYFVGHFVKP